MEQELLKRLDLASAKLGIVAGQIWSILIRQAQIEDLTDLGWTIISIAILVFCGRAIVIIWRSDKDNQEIPLVAALLASVIFCFVLIVCLTSLPTELLNPQYFAFEELGKILKMK